MVDTQLRPCKVVSPALLHAFSTVPREVFVAEVYQPTAYCDDCIKLEGNRFMLPPFLLGQLIQALNLKTEDNVLVIGCGTGYTAAIMGYLIKKVVTLEDNPVLAKRIEANLVQCRVSGAETVVGSLPAGWSKAAPYDGILINGAIPEVPKAVFKQLADQGRLVAILQQGKNKLGAAYLFQRSGENISKQLLFKVACPVLQEFSAKPKFLFS